MGVNVFNNKHIHDYPQWHCIALGVTKRQLFNPFPFKRELTLLDQSSAYLLVNSPLRLSDLCLQTGMVTGRNEFRRLLKQGGIKWNGATIIGDFELDAKTPSVSDVVRIGKNRVLEICVPLDEWSWAWLWESFKNVFNRV